MGRVRLSFFSVTIVVFLFFQSKVIWAETSLVQNSDLPRTIRLIVTHCEPAPFDTDELLSLFRLEFPHSEVSVGSGNVFGMEIQAEITIVAETCQSSGIGLTLLRIETSQRAERSLDFADTPPSERARVLALSLAELIHTSWVELGISDEAQPETPVDRQTEEPLDTQEPREPRRVEMAEQVLENASVSPSVSAPSRDAIPRHPALAMKIALLFYPLYGGVLLGPQLAFSIGLSRSIPLRFGVDLGVFWGGGPTSVGDIESFALLGGLGLYYEGGTEIIRGVFGPRIEFGWGWADGRPYDPSVPVQGVDRPIFSAMGVGSFQIAFHRRLRVMFDVLVGYTFVGLVPEGRGERAGGVAGPVLGIDLAVAYIF